MSSNTNTENIELRRRVAGLEKELELAQARLQTKAHSDAALALHRHHSQANLHQYGHSSSIVFVDPEEHPDYWTEQAKQAGLTGSVCRTVIRMNLDQFLHRPKLHQWLQGGKIYREAIERVSSRFELFFDLLFVGIVHQIAETTSEQATGVGLAKYVLTYTPAYSIWSDARDLGNQFSNDDVTQRAYILWIMILLVGYSINVSGIEVGEEDFHLGDSSANAIQWSLGFFLIAKLSRIILQNVYGIFLPKSRIHFLIGSFPLVLTCIFALAAIFVKLRAVVALVAVAMACDYVLRIVGVLIYKTLEQASNRREDLAAAFNSGADSDEKDIGEAAINNQRLEAYFSTSETRLPAINIEHHVDRLGAFITIVLGEMVVNVFFRAVGSTGLNREIGRSFLGLMIAFNLNWIYFDSSPKRMHFVHALRRHWLTAFAFTFLHLPLSLGLLLASSAINRMITTESTEEPEFSGLLWFFGAGLGISVLVLATIGMLHKVMDDNIPQEMEASHHHHHRHATAPVSEKIKKSRARSRIIVYGTRYIAGIIMCLIPLAGDHLDTTSYLAIYMSITAFLIIEETIGRVERTDCEIEAETERQERED